MAAESGTLLLDSFSLIAQLVLRNEHQHPPGSATFRHCVDPLHACHKHNDVN